MAWGSLGAIVFEALVSPEQFRAQNEYTYAEHQVVEAPPLLQWLANGSQQISLDFSFHVSYCDPNSQMLALRRAAEQHQALALVFGNGGFRGYFVIQSLEETFQQTADDGSYVALIAKIELREWFLATSSGGTSAVTLPTGATTRTATPPPAILTSTPGSGSPAPYNALAPIGPSNTLPPAAIVTLSNAGVPPGTTYSSAPYTEPGTSALAGPGPGTPDPSIDFSSVPTRSIARGGW